MRPIKGILLPGIFLLLILVAWQARAQRPDEKIFFEQERVLPKADYLKVKIADPFIELHTGPGGGYPIFHVVDRGIEVEVMSRKTDWFRIRTREGKIGWASREQMRETLLPDGERFSMVEHGLEDFSTRKWVIGMTGGEFESAPVFTFFTAYSFTENLAAELHFGQSVGRKSSSTFLKTNLVMQPMPEFTYSPYLTLGLGEIEVDPAATLITPVEDSNTFAQFGIGLQRYISRSFLARLEFNEYIIFAADSTRNDNEEVNEWKFGFAVFF